MNENTNNQENKSQVTSSIQEFAKKHGKVTIHVDTMKRSDGSEFEVAGLKFGKGPSACFAAFSSKIAHEDNSQRNEEFRGLDAVAIGKKVWANKDNFQILHKKNQETGELMYRSNGEPIYTICDYNEFGKDLAELN